MSTTDRWALTVAGLQGQPWPMPGYIAGRIHNCGDDPEPAGLPAWAYLPAAELARREGISRQGAYVRLRKVRAALVNETADTEGATPD